MGVFSFSCPSTGRAIDPGIDGLEASQSAGIRFTALHVRCPHCGEHHEIKIDEAALNEAPYMAATFTPAVRPAPSPGA